jgi:hypothetical protein
MEIKWHYEEDRVIHTARIDELTEPIPAAAKPAVPDFTAADIDSARQSKEAAQSQDSAANKPAANKPLLQRILQRILGR